MRRRLTVATVIATASLLLGVGCGGDSSEDTPEVNPQAVERSVAAILNKCIEASYDQFGDDPPTDDSAISIHVNRLIRAYKTDPDASLKGTDLKAKTVRGALEGTAQTLDDCKPEDATRINNALTAVE